RQNPGIANVAADQVDVDHAFALAFKIDWEGGFRVKEGRKKRGEQWEKQKFKG
ncbi:MAG: hypothetical protein IH886_12100, partial [Nitrospinae bacterium]|nr:hypothetical protein [Nitrospinota bacterium]